MDEKNKYAYTIIHLENLTVFQRTRIFRSEGTLFNKIEEVKLVNINTALVNIHIWRIIY